MRIRTVGWKMDRLILRKYSLLLIFFTFTYLDNQILKKFLVPCTAATVLAKVDDETACEKSQVCKPSDLPVYPEEECGCGLVNISTPFCPPDLTLYWTDYITTH